jgi:MFS family permease
MTAAAFKDAVRAPPNARVVAATVALTPPYATLGPAAPWLLVAFRIVQGFALGGEVGPSSVYLMESAPPARRGCYASWQIASQGLAVAAAGIVGVILSALLTKQQLSDWGWRVPFLLCLALIPVAFRLRGEMTETLTRSTALPVPAATQVKYVVLGALLIIGGTVSTYVGNFMSTYAITTLKLPATLSLSATLVVGFATFGFALFGGWLGDRFGRKGMVLWPRVALAVLIQPADALVDGPRGRRPHVDVGGDQPRHRAGVAAQSDARHRLRHLLRHRRLDLRRLDATGRRQADRLDGKSRRAGLLRDRDELDHHRRSARRA